MLHNNATSLAGLSYGPTELGKAAWVKRAFLRARFEQRMVEEDDGIERCLWMSFCDTGRPKGKQFLGVIIMWSPGVAHAIDRAWKLGINPGGEIMSYIINPNKIKPEHFDRLLTKQELTMAGYCDASGFEAVGKALESAGMW